MPALMEARAVRRRLLIRAPAASAAPRRDAEEEQPIFCRPRYHFHEQPDALKLVVHIPGADPTGIDLEVDAPDLTITAARHQSTRLPQESSPLAEAGQEHDYQLRLRLGLHLAYQSLQAELHGSTLTVTIPKTATTVALAQ